MVEVVPERGRERKGERKTERKETIFRKRKTGRKKEEEKKGGGGEKNKSLKILYCQNKNKQNNLKQG